MEMSENLLLLDAFALIYRAYYAFINNPRITTSGVNTSATFGFCTFLSEILEEQKPKYIGVVFDPDGGTFRHDIYPEYKGQRPPMPEDLRKSIPYIKRIIEALGIKTISVPKYEADDVIGTLAKRAESEGFSVLMVTPDKDYAQLVSENIIMYKPGRSGAPAETWGIPEVLDKFGIERVEQVVDILGLMGDSADNVPGCEGIGPKTAASLVYKYGSIEGIYEHIDEVKGKQRENLLQCKDTVMLSKELVTICTSAPTDVTTEDLARGEVNSEEVRSILRELEIFSLIDRMLSSGRRLEEAPDLQHEEDLHLTITDCTGLKSVVEKILQGKVAVNSEGDAHDKAGDAQGKDASAGLGKTDGETATAGQGEATKSFACVFVFKDGYNLYTSWPEKVILCSEKSSVSVVNLCANPAEELTAMKSLFSNPKMRWISADAKRDLILLKRLNIDVECEIFDITVAHYILHPDYSHSLQRIALELLHYQFDTGVAPKTQLSLFDENVEVDNTLVATECNITYRLMPLLAKELEKNNLTKLFYELEMPVTRVLADMEAEGVSIDIDALEELSTEFRQKADEAEQKIYEAAGHPFNINSPKQLGVILFEELKLDPSQKRTKSGQYTTSEQELSKLADKHPIIDLIFEYRSLKKLLSTYTEALPTFINSADNKIHTTFNQTATATGRLSSLNPNLQNIPIRTEDGSLIRKAFVAGEKDYCFFSADYSQVELRIMASLSNTPELIDAFRRGEDIHVATASKIYKVPIEEVTHEMRRRAKTANFGIIYGISAWGLAERLKISRREGKELIDGYFEMYPGVKRYMESAIEHARSKRYVETILGRRRYLPDINSHNPNVRGVAERNAINAPIQGSAADIIKMAMICIWREIKRRGLKSRMIIQVHDELNFKCHNSEREELQELVVNCMEHVVDLQVPLTVSFGFGSNWFEAH